MIDFLAKRRPQVVDIARIAGGGDVGGAAARPGEHRVLDYLADKAIVVEGRCQILGDEEGGEHLGNGVLLLVSVLLSAAGFAVKSQARDCCADAKVSGFAKEIASIQAVLRDVCDLGSYFKLVHSVVLRI